jgi:hypothetical protein
LNGEIGGFGFAEQQVLGDKTQKSARPSGDQDSSMASALAPRAFKAS